jgi:hypothetical protein
MKKAKVEILPTLLLCITTGVIFGVIIFLVLRSNLQPTPNKNPPPIQNIYNTNNSESRYDRAPEPSQGLPLPGSLPFNIPTQGYPSSFQSIGIINVGDQILPLYGRRTTGSSDRWNYYTRTDTYNPVPLPIQFQKRDCMDDVGCQEILSGEHIRIDALRKEGKTNIYNFNGPRYIPM